MLPFVKCIEPYVLLVCSGTNRKFFFALVYDFLGTAECRDY